MEALIEKFEKKNVFFFHTLGGDEDLPNIHFKKHYRLNYPVISDNLDRYRHIIRVSGITNVAIFGGDGTCVYNKPFMDGEFKPAIETALAKIDGPNLKSSMFIDGGTIYASAVKREGRIVRERMPSMVAGPSGDLHVAYVSDASGSNDILLRSGSRGRWKKPVKVAATQADEYAPSVIALGKGLALVAYVSNEGGKYDIYAALMKNGRRRKTYRVTKSSDDAMAPFLCRGDQGDAWLAWYEWNKRQYKTGFLSRDREIFAARLTGRGWSNPVQVSPRNVPSYEDHADPVVTSDGKGGAWIAWAWDYHGTLRRERPPVEENSIFLRHIDVKMTPGKILAPGFRGKGRARDYRPTIAVARDGAPCVAWDNSHKSSLGYNAKAIFVNRLKGKDFEEQTEAAASRGQIDSPRLIRHPEGGLFLLWGQQTRAGWELWLRKVDGGDGDDGDDGETLGTAIRLEVKSNSPRYPSGCFDSSGNLWVAYTHTGGKKWKVVAEAIRSR